MPDVWVGARVKITAGDHAGSHGVVRSVHQQGASGYAQVFVTSHGNLRVQLEDLRSAEEVE
ncbi:MAG: KOW motif-containing protein [Gaiellales bacterium]